MSSDIQAPALHRFHGGLHLPGHKTESTQQPPQNALLPRHVVLPLRQHIGEAAEPIVTVGSQVKKGQVIAQSVGYISSPVHASTSGAVVAIDDFRTPHPSGLATRCIVIEADGEDRWADHLPAPLADFTAEDAVTLRDKIRQAGIVGLGGAAFPTAIKLNPQTADQRGIHTLIVNGAECEPYITCDDMLMRRHAEEIISGIRIVQHILNPQRTLIGIEDNKPEAIQAMQQAVDKADLQTTQVIVVPTRYPTGGEKQLIKVLTNLEVPSHGLPADIGIVCQNVGTLLAIHNAIIEGIPLIERLVTVTGDAVAEPQNRYARIGTPFSELIQACGGYQGNVERLLMGGPMMGIAVVSDEVPIIKSTNCLLAATPASIPPPSDPLACIRCGECETVCPAQLLPQMLYWHAHAQDFEKVQDYNLFDCIECGCCAVVCPSHIPLVHYYRYAKTEIWQQEKKRQKADRARRRHEFHLERLERAAREKAQKLAAKKAALEKKKQAQAKAADHSSEDPKKAAIAAALARANAKKAARAKQPQSSDSQTTPAQEDSATESTNDS